MSMRLRTTLVFCAGACFAVGSFSSCTRTTKLNREEYSTLSSSPTSPLEIRTRDGSRYIARKTSVTDSVIVVLSGEAVPPAGSKPSKLSKSVTLRVSDIESISVYQVDDNKTLIVVLGILVLVVGIAALGAFPGGL